MTTLVFIYGTLKRVGCNHEYLSGQRFVAEAATAPLYRLYALDGYPGMVMDKESGLSVQGELWEVDAPALARLDELEDVQGGEYVRVVIVMAEPFNEQRVEGYLYLLSVRSRQELGSSWQE